MITFVSSPLVCAVAFARAGLSGASPANVYLTCLGDSQRGTLFERARCLFLGIGGWVTKSVGLRRQHACMGGMASMGEGLICLLLLPHPCCFLFTFRSSTPFSILAILAYSSCMLIESTVLWGSSSFVIEHLSTCGRSWSLLLSLVAGCGR